MDSYGAWKAFAVSGRIEDYLNYRQETENGNSLENVRFEGTNHEGESGEKDGEWKLPLW